MKHPDDNRREMLLRMRTIARASGMINLERLCYGWAPVFERIRRYPEHRKRYVFGMFYEGDPENDDPELRQGFPNGRYVAHAMSRLMDMQLLSARDFQKQEAAAGYLKTHLDMLKKYGVFIPWMPNWQEAKHAVRRSSSLPAWETGREDFMQTVHEQAYAAIRKPENPMTWGLQGAIKDLADYAAMEVMRDVRFRCHQVLPADTSETEWWGYGVITGAKGQNYAEPIADICETGLIISDVMLEDGRIKAWLSGESIRKKIDVMEVPYPPSDEDVALVNSAHTTKIL